MEKKKIKFITDAALIVVGVAGIILLPKITIPTMLGVGGTIVYQKFFNNKN